MASYEYSKRLGVIHDSQFQAALDCFGLGRLIGAESAPGGLFGQNVFLDTTEGRLVFRGAPHWDEHREFDWHFQKERFFSQLVHDSANGPAVPWPYLLEEDTALFGWPYAVMLRLDGTAAWPEPAEISDGGRAALAHDMGRTLAALHSVEMPRAGVYDKQRDAVRPLEGTYFEYVAGRVRALVAASRPLPGMSSDDVAWVEWLLADSRPAFDAPFQPCVIHLDFHDGNIVANPDEGWRVSGVIDWMTAEVGHPEADLVRYIGHHTDHGPAHAPRAFMRSYQQMRPEKPGSRERFPLFVLWERLLIWEYRQRNARLFKVRFREWAARYMEPPV